MSGGIRPPTEWPLLLAGPMLRRVTATSAAIWICTREACTAGVLLYAGSHVRHDDGDIPVNLPAGQTSPPMQTLERLGERMFMTVLVVELPASSPAGMTFSYDLRIDAGGGVKGLFQLGLLGGTQGEVGAAFDARRAEVPLGYAPGFLPSFVTPVNDPAALRFAHASCRKPHGGKPAEPDALELVDTHLADVASGAIPAAERVQQLILTGDQIYADDVAPALLSALTEAGAALLGWNESIPGVPAGLDHLLEPGWRTRFLSIDGIELKETVDGETTDYSASHLLRFGEWCAMYLFAWSDALWRIDSHGAYDLPAEPSSLPVAEINQLLSVADTLGVVALPPAVTRAGELLERYTKFFVQLKKQWKESRAQVLGYGHSIRAIRRVLANVATFTMFDDHEITDDWFLNQRVHDRLKGGGGTGPAAEVGPRLLRNGLSAYAFFQHWGNVPGDFATGTRGAELLDLWRHSGPSGCTLRTSTRAADRLLGVVTGSSPIPPTSGAPRTAFERMRWDYAVGFPAHRLVVLDTRTWRYFPPGDRFSWASLAPLVPGPPGTPAACGAPQLNALATAWRNAGTATGEPVLTALGNAIDAYRTFAVDVHATRQTVDANFRATMLALATLLDALPRRPATNRADPIDARFREALGNPSAAAALFTGLDDAHAVDAMIATLRAAADADFGPRSTPLTLLLRALADFADSAAARSAAGMAFATRRAATAANDRLWQAVCLVSSTDSAYAATLTTVNLVLVAADSLTATIGVDRLAGKIFRDGSGRLGAGLIRAEALPFMVTEPLATVGPDVPVTLLLSPAPIFGNRVVEFAQLLKVLSLTARGEAGEEELDYEAWRCNVPAMIDLFEAVAAAGTTSCVVVLSGDVHYAGSSVNDVRTLRARTRYLQLTSSSTRNSDKMTRTLERLDDLLYTADGGLHLVQADWTRLLESGGSTLPHLADLAFQKVADVLGDARNAIDVDRQLENLRHWWDSSQLTLDDVLRVGERMVMAGPNTVRAAVNEGAWSLYSAIELISDVADDPLLTVFGDFLTAGPALRENLHAFYAEVGLDPAHGLTVEAKVITDLRADRLAAAPVATRVVGETRTRRILNTWARRTVGHANVGFVRLGVRGEQLVEVKHDLRWYPIDEPERHQNPVTRDDWYDTRHRLGWLDLPADIARTGAGAP